MGDLKRILSKPGFNPEDYVSNISSEDGEDKLLETKQNVQILADETAQALKKNVYKNYSQFIETAKEISVHTILHYISSLSYQWISHCGNLTYRLKAYPYTKARIDHRIKQLTEGLMSELQVTPERSLRGGPRAARRAVTQLIRLGKSAQACELFLNNRSAIIKYNIRQLKFEGSTTLYIKRLCTGFFSSLAETGKEFMKAFPQNYGCYSAIVVWSHQELKIFVDMFKRQVFGGKSNLSIIAECVMLARQHCQELHSIGLDLSFTLDLFINDDIKRVIQETKDHIIEGVKYRAADDLWRPMNHLSKTACDRFIEDMQLLGFSQMSTCVYDDCFVNLTINTVQFTKTTLIFVDDTLKMYTPDLGVFINNAIADIFKAHILHIQNSLKRAKFAKDQTFIMKNAQFILEEFLGIAETFYRDKDIVFPKELISVNNEFRRLKTLAKSLS
ncbi:exocyst complex component 8-like [Octopus sinensis]|uniref:Exocyst complex component 8-like n=1 Tax=Octopus sinensis TaxID=2607531 RepID=A0A6P7TC05_9MOLL|nr:exocyst complex component 8-like [Octopus sinensis]